MDKLLIIDGNLDDYLELIEEFCNHSQPTVERLTFFTTQEEKERIEKMCTIYSMDGLSFNTFVENELGFKDIGLILNAAQGYTRVIIGKHLGDNADTLQTIKYLMRDVKVRC